MNVITGLAMVFCGIAAASGIAARLQGDRRVAIDQLAFFQGCVGLPTAGWGVWVLVLSLARLYQLQTNPVWWGTFLGTGVLEVVLGTVLAVGLLGPEWFRGRPDAADRSHRLRDRLTTVEIPLGLLAIAAGAWCFAAAFAFHEI